MMQKFNKLFNPRRTPQSAPIPGSIQVRNDAGGYAWTMDRRQLLDRFLVLGTEAGSYSLRRACSERGDRHERGGAAGAERPRTVARIAASGRGPVGV